MKDLAWGLVGAVLIAGAYVLGFWTVVGLTAIGSVARRFRWVFDR